jgi:uncharacterized protein YuzE
MFFRINFELEEVTGRLVAFYLWFKQSRFVTDTHSLIDGVANADFDAAGEICGIELLGPCKIEDVEDRLSLNHLEMRALHDYFPAASAWEER